MAGSESADRRLLIELCRSVYLTGEQKAALARLLGVRLREPRLVATTANATATIDYQRFLHGSGGE